MIICEVCPSNVWPAHIIERAISDAAGHEINRRYDLNATMAGGIKLSTRPDAVYRDVERHFLASMQPAGNA